MARITRAHIEKRLDQLARREGLCPVHMTRLWCVHDFWWVGSPAEWDELEALVWRMEPYRNRKRLQPSGVLCPTCPDQEPLYCQECNQGEAKPFWIPDEVMSLSQYDRYLELSKRLEVKPPGTPHHLLCQDDAFLSRDNNGMSTSLESVTTPLPSPEPIPPPPLPVETPVLVVSDEDDAVDDEEADTELVSLVAELSRRLGTR